MKRMSSKSFTLLEKNTLTGFTLMELLVVISIIGLLGGILLPALSIAHQRALGAACLSNLRQIGIALSFYADDYRGLHPIAGVDPEWGEKDLPSPPGTGTYGWMYQLYPYVNDKKLYSCPANKEFPDYSYFLSAKAAFEEADGQFASVNIRKIQYPTAFVLAGDTTTGGSSPLVDFQPDDCDKDDYTQNCVGGVCWPWTGWQVHIMKGQNILFADGHAYWFGGYVEGLMTFRYDEIHPWCEPEDL